MLTHATGHPFSRSYGVILPSSLTRVLSRALGFSPHLPVSVCGTGTLILARGFSWQCGISHFATKLRSPSHLRLNVRRICLPDLPTCLNALNQRCASPTLLRPPIAQTLTGGTGILTCCPSPTPFGLGLGPTNPERTNLPQETLGFRRAGFSPVFSLLMPAFSLLYTSTSPYGHASTRIQNAPLPLVSLHTIHSFGDYA